MFLRSLVEAIWRLLVLSFFAFDERNFLGVKCAGDERFKLGSCRVEEDGMNPATEVSESVRVAFTFLGA